MSNLKRGILVVLLCLIYATTGLAQDLTTEGIEFNGRLYRSFDDLIAVALHATGARSLEDLEGLEDFGDIFLACGPRLTVEVLERGHYDFRYDTMVCFTNEEESDALYARNLQLEAEYQGHFPRFPSGTNQDGATASDDHHVCNESPRGTPFRYIGYNGAFDDVCPSYRRSYPGSIVESYWQVGDGRTYFYFFSHLDLHWWLNSSVFIVDAEMRRWRISRYSWGRSH